MLEIVAPTPSTNGRGIQNEYQIAVTRSVRSSVRGVPSAAVDNIPYIRGERASDDSTHDPKPLAAVPGSDIRMSHPDPNRSNAFHAPRILEHLRDRRHHNTSHVHLRSPLLALLQQPIVVTFGILLRIGLNRTTMNIALSFHGVG
jgi:hypothetical protein